MLFRSLLNNAKQAALSQQTQAQKMQADAQYIQDQANAMFKDAHAQGYVDQQTSRSLGTQSIFSEATAHRDSLKELLASAKGINDIEGLMDLCEGLLGLVDDYFVVQESGVKAAVWQNLNQLYVLYNKQAKDLDPSVRSRVMNILFLALNNTYLADQTQLGNCYTWINTLIKNALLAPGQKEFDLQQQFGE